MTIAIHTLGCKVNRCDADALISELTAAGHNAFHTREFDVCADIFVINTCTVTQASDKKSRQMLRRAKNKNPNALVAMCGCMAKNSAGIDGVDFIFDAREPEMFFTELEKALQRHELESPSSRHSSLPRHSGLDPESRLKNGDARGRLRVKPAMTELGATAESSATTELGAMTESSAYTLTRSFIKIQDGCDRFCSYCIVPHVRGDVTSRPLEEILSRAQTLIYAGALEIVLTGIQVAAYGNDLAELIRRTAALNGLKRLRLSSIDPWAVNENFLHAVAEAEVLCEHFHLSLQSGCDATLQKMNRRYTTDEYKKAADALRKIRPNAALTTDIIVGFPGETNSEFAQSLAFVREIAFANVHVFEYSPREGTPAASFAEQVSPKVKSERGKIMRDAVAELQKNFLQNQIGKICSVLFEKEKPHSVFEGHSENYCTVQVEAAADLQNSIHQVKIRNYTENILKGEIVHGNTKN